MFLRHAVPLMGTRRPEERQEDHEEDQPLPQPLTSAPEEITEDGEEEPEEQTQQKKISMAHMTSPNVHDPASTSFSS
jgi:hypothetical protein